MGKAAPLAVRLVFLGAKNSDGEHSPSATKPSNTKDAGGEQTSPKNPLMSQYTGDPGWKQSPQQLLCLSHPQNRSMCRAQLC